MADIHIRNVSDRLLWALKRKAADEQTTLKALVVPALEMLANSRAMEIYPVEPMEELNADRKHGAGWTENFYPRKRKRSRIVTKK